MKATTKDRRLHTKSVLAAIDRGEEVLTTYQGEPRASYFVETYALSHNLQPADALIAASALSTGHTLLTANDRHYGFIDGVDIEVFMP